jgi:hypothetical protein
MKNSQKDPKDQVPSPKTGRILAKTAKIAATLPPGIVAVLPLAPAPYQPPDPPPKPVLSRTDKASWTRANKATLASGRVSAGFIKRFVSKPPKSVSAPRRTIARQQRRAVRVPAAASASADDSGDGGDGPRPSTYCSSPMFLYNTKPFDVGMLYAAGLYPRHELIDVSRLYRDGRHFMQTFHDHVSACSEFVTIADASLIVGRGVFQEWEHFRAVHPEAVPVVIVTDPKGATRSAEIQDMAVIDEGRDWVRYAEVISA